MGFANAPQAQNQRALRHVRGSLLPAGWRVAPIRVIANARTNSVIVDATLSPAAQIISRNDVSWSPPFNAARHLGSCPGLSLREHRRGHNGRPHCGLRIGPKEGRADPPSWIRDFPHAARTGIQPDLREVSPTNLAIEKRNGGNLFIARKVGTTWGPRLELHIVALCATIPRRSRG